MKLRRSELIHGSVVVCLEIVKCRCEESKIRAEQTSKLLAQVKNGVQHLSEKLQHIKMVAFSFSLRPKRLSFHSLRHIF